MFKIIQKNYHNLGRILDFSFREEKECREFVLLHCEEYVTDVGFSVFTLKGATGNHNSQSMKSWYILEDKDIPGFLKESDRYSKVFVNNAEEILIDLFS
jgi:hypothetical protein